MLALLTGEGRLPAFLRERLAASGQDFLWCDMNGAAGADYALTLGGLGSLLAELRDRGVQRLCLAGSLRRERLELGPVDAATEPMLERLQGALAAGDNAALVTLLALLEDEGFEITGAHELCPDLLPQPGLATTAGPTEADESDADRAAAILAATGPADIGQACIVHRGQALAIEALPGTDFMIDSVARFRDGSGQAGGILFKAPKPGQDRRADLPAIGPATADLAARAGLSGLVIEAGGVMVLDPEETIAACDGSGLFLWVRPGGP